MSNESDLNESLKILKNLISDNLKHNGKKWYSHICYAAGYLETEIRRLKKCHKCS